MKPQFTNTALASIFFWSENELLSKAEAYRNHTSQLFYTPDIKLNGYYGYSAPFKQWIYNKGISGASIMSGISGSINLTAGQSGMKIDYENGRVLLPTSFGTGLNISGTYAFKELNFYLSTETEESLLNDAKFTLNSRFINQIPTNGIQPYSQVTPAIFINLINNDSEPFELGGLDNTNVSFSFVVMTETMNQLNAVLGVYGDAKKKYFPQMSIYQDPLNEYGDIKTGIYPNGYNYNEIMQNSGPGDLFFIESVMAAKATDTVKLNDRLFAGIIDIDVSKIRTTN